MKDDLLRIKHLTTTYTFKWWQKAALYTYVVFANIIPWTLLAITVLAILALIGIFFFVYPLHAALTFLFIFILVFCAYGEHLTWYPEQNAKPKDPNVKE